MILFMKVKDIMQTKLTKVSSRISVLEAAEIMAEMHIGSVLIERNGDPIGIVTQGDIISKVVAKGENPQEITVSEIQNTSMIMVDEDTDIIDASDLLAKYNVRRLVVTKNGKVVGIVSSKVTGSKLRQILNEYKK